MLIHSLLKVQIQVSVTYLTVRSYLKVDVHFYVDYVD